MSTFVSIDWDFFPRYGNEDTFTNDEGARVDGWTLFDWGHAEQGMAAHESIWTIRAADWARRGLKMEDHFAILPLKGCVTPTAFYEEVATRLNVDDIPVWYADSHVQAYMALIEQPEDPPWVYHFDAHHDLGYRDDAIKKAITSGKADCGDWLYHALRNELIEGVTVIYPPWRGWDEWAQLGDPRWLEPFDGRYEAMTWYSWLEEPHRHGDLSDFGCGAFLCRSSAWTPPYLDAAFADLVRAFTSPEEAAAYLPRGLDGLPERKWDPAAIAELDAAMARAMAQFK